MHFGSLWGDIRFAFRVFKRSPAVALTVIGTLAVALGLNATAYSFFNAYVVKPAAVRDPGALYVASWENRGGFFHRFSWTEAEEFGREMAGVFSETYVSMSVAGSNLNMLIKTRGGKMSSAMRQIDADLSAAAPGVAEQIITAQDLVETRVYPFQAMSWAAGVIGGVALVLTISGIYGVLAYAVARRTKEIGIRMALGESVAGVVGLILKQSMRLCAIGLGIGLTLAVALSTALASTLVMMDTFDMAAFSGGSVIVIAACLAAAFDPARRAAGVEPLVALRFE
jgi:hypothetical protein